MGGHAVPSGSAKQSAPPGQPKPKSSTKPSTVPTSCIPQHVAHPTSNAPLAILFAQDLPPIDGCTPCFEQGLKQALDISGTCMAAFIVSSTEGDHQFVPVWGSGQQIEEALVKQCSGNIAPAVAAPAPLGSTALSTPTSTRPGVPSSNTPAVASTTITMTPTPSTQQLPSLPPGLLMLSVHGGGHPKLSNGHNFSYDPLYTGA
ncbi:hypothetical protein E4T56_gene11673 [Termitomyces sp. T112]|nr:hypothetical protein E4T56_gene11673 [Termitomyces sp. T112]